MPTTPSPHAVRLGRIVLVALATVALACVTAACSLDRSGPAPSGAARPITQGGCVTNTSPTELFAAADCTGSALRVLELHTDVSRTCAQVPGVTADWTVSSVGHRLCLGPLDVDPVTAVNVATVDECLTGDIHDEPQRVDCAGPAARYQVLRRIDDATSSAECGAGADVSPTHEWTLAESTLDEQGQVTTNTRRVMFCLATAASRPGGPVDNARAGDCLQDTAADSFVVADCAAPTATHRVVDRYDSTAIDPQVSCSSNPAATSYLTQERTGGTVPFGGYVLCLAPR